MVILFILSNFCTENTHYPLSVSKSFHTLVAWAAASKVTSSSSLFKSFQLLALAEFVSYVCKSDLLLISAIAPDMSAPSSAIPIIIVS